MDGTDVVAAVREECATELDRLGSEKALVAATDAVLERDAVLDAAGAAEARARDTFSRWATDETDATARHAFDAIAGTEREHFERVAEHHPTTPEDPPLDGVHEYLDGLDDTAARVGAGLVGRPLVSSRSMLQVINFFVNEGANAEADLFRALRAETDDIVERGAELLDSVCDSEGDYERAREAAVRVVEIAYDEYATGLEGLGVDPKPVC
ncbi:rubrerythrin family protein [Halosegnis marinus]|uniref:Rubrerythrin n=1 Tax=Halosegnis marinus TaxID=3034023 RepID=A0ABD5ZP92_9EURY|nr:rubrerythrin family protein [Halosegnis sp. DT85]